jgi:hypothetical protein
MELRGVERYWETRVELVSALKEGAASSFMAVPEVKMEVQEGVYVVDVEGASLINSTAQGQALAAASASSPVLLLFRYAQATQAALASLGAPPDFEPLQAFELHLQEEYGGFRRDQMHRRTGE